MNQSIRVKYEIIKINGQDPERSYVFAHPYGAPADETLGALAEFKEAIEARVEELRNAQAIQGPTEEQGVNDGN
jgi:hypothetical protein